MMCSLEDSVPPPGKYSICGSHPLLFLIPLVESSSPRPGLDPFVPNSSPVSPASFTPPCVPLFSRSQVLPRLCVISLSFFLLLPADVSPRRRILNVSRSVWKQANVASDLWEKLTARCVDRHRSDSLIALSSWAWTQSDLRIMILVDGCCIGSNSSILLQRESLEIPAFILITLEGWNPLYDHAL